MKTILTPAIASFALSADAAPAAGGTQVVIHSGRFGAGEMNKTVEQWARGGARSG